MITIVAPTYCSAQHLASVLGGHLENFPHHMKSVEFIDTMRSLHSGHHNILFSFNVLLLTKVYIGEALPLQSQNFDEDSSSMFNFFLFWVQLPFL
jgi:hypothetical protein